MTVNLLDFDLEGLAAFCEGLGEKRFRAVQLFRWIHQRGASDFSQMTDLARSLRGALQRAVFGHVEHDLELAFVVVGQHLDQHAARGHERQGTAQQRADQAEEGPAPQRSPHQPRHQPAVRARSAILPMDLATASGAPAQQPRRCPRGHHEGDGQRKHHRR